ncbi:SDR family oxidoreductase [Gordonia sp. TBRC 11910]|uniref:SDR family oxidoreductase n=1 Tax=Gordonia asplenii TaxID=2725283 RepID=A0A848KZ42_9ACTN|nr:SDR family oxidoreductase [Gordonia asplenii]NMO03482.1 SDR family oxidoreductase [Gordonia asplenii]
MNAVTNAPVAIVTGAGSGIGRAVAHALLDAGFRVALAGRRPEPLVQTAGDHRQAMTVVADVSRAADVDALFERTVDRWGRVDLLFNNAGIFGPAGAVDEISLDDWTRTLDINVTGAMLCTAAAVRVMKSQVPQGGRIINNGSISAHRPRPRSVAYAVSKHALTGLTRATALDGRRYGITCGQIDIGNTHTDITDHIGVGEGAEQPDGRRIVEPTFPVEEAARAVLTMALLPPSATIGSLTITASGMPYDGRG